MKREDISKAINGIDTRYIQEAVDYTTKKTGVKNLQAGILLLLPLQQLFFCVLLLAGQA